MLSCTQNFEFLTFRQIKYETKSALLSDYLDNIFFLTSWKMLAKKFIDSNLI